MPIPSTVEGFIDWARRPFRVEDPDGPSAGVQAAPGLTGGNWTIVQRFPGEILTADKYNADRQIVVDNQTPLMTDDYSATVAQFQATTDPFPGGAVSLALSLAGELERIRFVLGSLNPDGHWYEVPTLGIHPAGGFRLSNDESLLGERLAGGYGSLIKMNTVDQVAIGADLPAGKLVVLGTATASTYVAGALNVAQGITCRDYLILEKGTWIQWDDILGVAVGGDNVLYLGQNNVHTVSQKYTYFPAGANITNLTVAGALEVDAGVHVDGNLAVDGNVNVGGSPVFVKNHWLHWADIYAMTVNSTNNWIYIGGNAAGVDLSKNVIMEGTLNVNQAAAFASNVTVAGAFTAGSINLSGGAGVVDGVTTLRAWCRYAGAFAGQYGFAGVTALGNALYQFTLTRAYPNGYAVTANMEGQGIVRIIVLNSQVFQCHVTNLEGEAVPNAFHVHVAGQI